MFRATVAAFDKMYLQAIPKITPSILNSTTPKYAPQHVFGTFGGHTDPMKDYHPSPDLLKRFLNGTLDAAERRRVVRHLLTACPACRKITRELLQEQMEMLRIVDWKA
jgi:hypothetical protein